MAKKLDPLLVEILTKYGERAEDAMWDCHGTWVVYHKAIERIAAKAGIVFEMPVVVEGNSAGKVVSIVVRGTMGERSEWSFGEAAPHNNKNGYPYAMAEKRAKDRVTLKLIGLHGLVYSEEESDDFKPQAAQAEKKHQVGFRDDGSRTSYALKKEQPELWDEFRREVDECATLVSLERLKTAWRSKATAEKWNKQYLSTAKEVFAAREEAIREEVWRLSEASPNELAELPAKTALEHSLASNDYVKNYTAG